MPDEKIIASPRTHERMSDEERDFRNIARNEVLGLAASGRWGEEVEVGFFNEGETSVVALVKGVDESVVAKCVRRAEVVEAELRWLDAWESKGVRVPGKRELIPGENPILLMEYVEFPSLNKMTISQRADKGYSREMGKVLGRMHYVRGEGHGRPKDGVFEGKFETMKEEMRVSLSEAVLNEAVEKGWILAGDLQYLSRGIGVLDADGVSVPGHNDFRPYNLFYEGMSIVVFDPDPYLTHPMVDLAGATIKSLIEGEEGRREASEIELGYGEHQLIDDRLRAAGLVVKGIRMTISMHRKGKVAKAESIIGIVRASYPELS